MATRRARVGVDLHDRYPNTGAPGDGELCEHRRAEISAAPTTKAPALVAGAVVPRFGMVTQHDGHAGLGEDQAGLDRRPCRGTSGETVPMRSLMTGRRRSSAAPPATAVAISTA